MRMRMMDKEKEEEELLVSSSSSSFHKLSSSRRVWFQQQMSAIAVGIGGGGSILLGGGKDNRMAMAAEETAVAAAAVVEMKTFVDPQGLFVFTLPKRFFALRRTNKGDLPDAKTGVGRRGSSIFTGGDMAKTEVVAIERYPIRVLLEDEGILATGDLSTLCPGVGNSPKAVADLITLHRDKERNLQQSAKSKILPGSLALSSDGKTLTFSLTNEIDVQKPELLMEQIGIDRLIRITLCKATLDSNDGNLMAIFASALEQDTKGPDGPALQQIMDSFVATDQSSKS
eukprot:CAMPEP_0197823628 /NCGR_PEP_ID=MMETSP1437-20131217/954_1 /TAXON_ID=49252 ORGANISM="Eucampia antarctica, Strain CCMP1452" /NCGR_SAMPLE_ID=MMETSP1437 /ASSEMBLY_ACC=CAM_ASM_001096 /LENGTH=284 /DNA_ID=CAMNT_0043422883 /DNA_START=208 /DNA_END=1062 /DNA_ORIENTATION=-